MLYVVGGGEENEILLFGVVLALRDSLSILLKFVLTFLFPRRSFGPVNDSYSAGILRTNAL